MAACLTICLKDGDDEEAHVVIKSPIFPSARLLIIALVLLGNFSANAGFLVLNFTLICMVNSTAVSILETPNFTAARVQSHMRVVAFPEYSSRPNCNNFNRPEGGSEVSSYNGDLIWTREVQANVIAGYSWGMVLFTIPAALVMHKTQSTKSVFLFATVVSSLSIVITPYIAYLPSGDWLVFVARILLGLTGGLVWPLTMAAAARWVPEREMGTMIAFASCGLSIAGTIDSFCGALCAFSPHGWTFAYYFCGGLNLLLVFFIAMYYNNDPTESRLVSPRELRDILANRSVDGGCDTVYECSVPYKEMLLSLPFWAILTSNFAEGWTLYFLADFMPMYIKEVLHFEAMSNGLCTALPYLLEVFSLIAFGILSDKMTIVPEEREADKHCLRQFSSTASVKIFQAVAFGGSALAFFIISLCDCTHPYVAVGSLCVCTICAAAGIVGYTRSTYLIAPAFAGVTASIGETVQSISSVVVPYAVAAMTRGQAVRGWQNATLSASGISFASMMFFLVFGSGDVQRWAKTGHVE